ncbi:MAG: hypothetical protein ACYC67_06560 [Prosthecobacter sp.]
MSAVSYSYVALIDVLGYKDKINQDRLSGSLDFRDALMKALEVFSDVNEADYSHEAISDTIIMRCAKRENIVEFIQLVRAVQIAFLSQKLFTRGAIVYQQHFQSGKVTYSLALAQAYELEQKKSIYPRVILDRNIIEMFNSGERKSNYLDGIIKSKLVSEWNGTYFVNVITKKNWKKIREYAAAIYREDKAKLLDNESAFAKHVWFENMIFSSQYADPSLARYIPSPKLLDSESIAVDVKSTANFKATPSARSDRKGEGRRR